VNLETMSFKRLGGPSQIFDVFIENQYFARVAESFGGVDILLQFLSHL
jgi:hypothetical protein